MIGASWPFALSTPKDNCPRTSSLPIAPTISGSTRFSGCRRAATSSSRSSGTRQVPASSRMLTVPSPPTLRNGTKTAPSLCGRSETRCRTTKCTSRTFYPGTPDSLQARVLNVQPGAHLRGIDVDASPSRTFRVAGSVTGMAAAATAGNQALRAQIQLRPVNSIGITTNAAQAPNAQSDPAGNFEIPRAIPGRYILTATVGNLVGRVPVDVRDRDVSSVLVQLGTGVRVTGRIAVEGGALTPQAMSALRVLLRPDPPMPGAQTFNVPITPDGSFSIPPATPTGVTAAAPPVGDYRINVSPLLMPPVGGDGTAPTPPPALQNAYVKSVTFGGMDVLNDRAIR